MAEFELTKLQQHLNLLKQEYTKLQTKYHQIESKYNTLIATNDENIEDTFAARLIKTIEQLYITKIYSDIHIKFMDRTVEAHRLVLTARSNLWNENVLKNTTELDWSEMDVEVADFIIKWLYTNAVDFHTDELTVKIVRKAHEFGLNKLVMDCELYLIGNVTIRNCVKFYSVAEEIGTKNLQEYCSGLISTHWNDLDTSDFEHMSGDLLYQMLKNKTDFPLHTAVRLQREDVVFLCLVENSSKLSDIVNVWNIGGELPLDMALRTKNVSIANTLIQHNADVNIRDNGGDALLHRAIKQSEAFAALFLMENNCDVQSSTRNGNDTALHLLANAIEIDDVNGLAKKMLKRGININAQNRLGFTALHIAIQTDNHILFEVLMTESRLDPNVTNTIGHAPIYYGLIKYESGDDRYIKSLLSIFAHTDWLYSPTNSHLIQILLENNAKNAALFLCDHINQSNHTDIDGVSILHTACKNNAAQLVEKLLEMGVVTEVHTTDNRRTALHWAVEYNAIDSIEIMQKFKEKINFNTRDNDGETPLSLALIFNHKELVSLLIDGGANVNARNGRDLTLLHQAIINEDGETALFLLDNGADVNAQTADSETPIQLAIRHHLGVVVDALCRRGVDMSALDRNGNCSLWAALESEQDDIASILVRHGADTDCWGEGPDGCRQTLLHRAIDENKENAAIFLIQAGCDLDTSRMPGSNGEGGEEAHDGAAPLHLCCQWGLENVVRTLVEHRANVNARDSDQRTPLHFAIENQHPTIISLLLSVPEIDLSLRDKNGLSPFACALAFRNNKAAESILDCMPNAAEQFDSKGYNFLHMAIKKGDIESALFLLTVNVDVNSRVQDATLTPPLHLAAKYGNEMLVRSLILVGARVDDRDAQKRTALHVAAESGNAPIVSALLQNNCDFDAVDKENDNALHIAVREGHISVVRVLLTESHIDAQAVNLKGRNPLHELCRYGKDNAAAICELFLECMPEYPINKPDINGNSPLLLAYMKGNAQLSRALVKAKACLAIENNEKVTIFNYQVPTKQLLNRLLDQLATPAPWTTNTDSCQECGKNFTTITVRPHHCRHCGRALCSRCTDQEVPIIKFGEHKPVRVCKICFNVVKTGGATS